MAPPRCAKTRELLSAYVDGALSPQARLSVQSHLAECPSCAAELEALKATAALIHDLPQARLPEDFHADLLRCVKAEAAPVATGAGQASRARAAARSGGWSVFWSGLGSRIGRAQLRGAAVVAGLLILVVWAGGFAYYLGLPIPGAERLGLRGSKDLASQGAPEMGINQAVGDAGGSKQYSLAAPEGKGGGAPSSDAAGSTGSAPGATFGAGAGGDLSGAAGTAGTAGIMSLDAVNPGRKVILTVNLNLECEDVAKARDQATAAAEGAGGFVESMNYWTDQEGQVSASLVLRVPGSSLSNVLGQLRPLGTVLGEQASRQDVTAQHIDLTSRLDNLRIQEQRLLALLGKAESLGDIFAIENELARVRTEIENYESQLRMLDDQVGFSTINLYLQPVGAGPAPGSGFWERLVDAFLKSLAWMGRLAEALVLALATIVAPVVVFGGLIWLVVRAIQARRRKAGL